MKNFVLPIVALLFFWACESQTTTDRASDGENLITIGVIDSLYSNILEEQRKLWVYVPESAKNKDSPSEKYPVLYLLDGDAHFHSVTGMIKQLSTVNGNTVLPEMIVVGIPNTNRSRDLTPTHVEMDFWSGDSIRYDSGGGDKFLDFIEKELMPYVKKNYPVTDYTTFIGHSFGGLSVINALLTRPQLFNNYVAIDPSLWWDDQLLLNMAESALPEKKLDGKALFVGVANTMANSMNITTVQEDTTKGSTHIRSILQFSKSVEFMKNTGLAFDWKYYGDDSHGSVPLITEYDALRFLFSWYEFKDLDKFYDEASPASKDELIAIVNAHYAMISTKFAYTVLPAESLINMFAYMFMGRNQADKAFAFFDLNIRNYPNSANVFDSMGDYYVSQSDTIMAINYFSKAVEKGGGTQTKEKLEKLKIGKE